MVTYCASCGERISLLKAGRRSGARAGEQFLCPKCRELAREETESSGAEDPVDEELPEPRD